MKRKQFLAINLILTICWPVLQSTDIQLQNEKSEMSGAIEKIVDSGGHGPMPPWPPWLRHCPPQIDHEAEHAEITKTNYCHITFQFLT